MESVTETRTQNYSQLVNQYVKVRSFSERLCETLTAEDCAVQSMPDASPTRWHLAHTTWFFEQFLLSECAGYQEFNRDYMLLFNSYYNSVGQPYPRSQRGLLSRPSRDEVLAYRAYVDEALVSLLPQVEQLSERFWEILEVGLHHEQQHQELLLTDIKHAFSLNPIAPVYRHDSWPTSLDEDPLEWIKVAGGVYAVGHDGKGFGYDNEFPRHNVLVPSLHLAPRLVTCEEYLQFMEEGGYQRSELWLSLGWQTVSEQQWAAPLYWQQKGGEWYQFTLAGLTPIDPRLPVCHVSFFEADAFARWAGQRLPSETEWEIAAQGVSVDGNLADRLIDLGQAIHPHRSGGRSTGNHQFFGDVWEWTGSPYVAYPGYRPVDGALGEYNGKFMCNQYVLKGGSCATSSSHLRTSYRNFFPPTARWQFTGIRLASDE
ncbi:MAG: ergothioneine biosynthesis protein EgtB [Pirellulaceae bacterium]|nr:ergothioneine biosynthesis protein EgtB [Pirellulaceae bacterium]